MQQSLIFGTLHSGLFANVGKHNTPTPSAILPCGAAVSSVSLQWTFGHVWAAGSSRAAAAVGQRLPLSALAGKR